MPTQYDPPLNWTSAKPTKDGTYWYRAYKYKSNQSCEVRGKIARFAFDLHDYRIEDMEGEWWGPLASPDIAPDGTHYNCLDAVPAAPQMADEVRRGKCPECGKLVPDGMVVSGFAGTFCSKVCLQRAAVRSNPAEELEGLRAWKAEQQQALIRVGIVLLNAGYKGDGIHDGVSWLAAEVGRLKEAMNGPPELVPVWLWDGSLKAWIRNKAVVSAEPPSWIPS
jgi:hypothetical protein